MSFDPYKYIQDTTTFDPEAYTSGSGIQNEIARGQKAAIKGMANAAVGGYGPEILGTIGLLRGDKYLESRDAVAEDLEKAAVDYPMAYGGGSMAGGMVPGLLLPGPSPDAGLLRRVIHGGASGAAYGGLVNPGQTRDEIDPIQMEDRIANSVLGGAMGLGTSAVLEPITHVLSNRQKIAPDLARSSRIHAYKATNAPASKRLEDMKKGRVENLGQVVLDEALTPDAPFFASPEDIHLAVQPRLNQVGESIRTDVEAAAALPGSQHSIDTGVVARQAERKMPSATPDFATAGGKKVLSGPIQDEIDNLAMYGTPVDNPVDLIGHQPNATRTGRYTPMEPGGFDPYLDSSNSGTHIPGPQTIQPRWDSTPTQGYPPKYASLIPEGDPASMAYILGSHADPTKSGGLVAGTPEAVGATRGNGPSLDTRQRLTGPKELWWLNKGLGERTNFARTLPEMSEQERGVAELYFKTRDVLNKNVDGALGRGSSHPESMVEKGREFHRLKEVSDMSRAGAAAADPTEGLRWSDLGRSGLNFVTRQVGGRYHSFMARSSRKVAEMLAKDPGAFGRLGKVLSDAYRKSPAAFNSTVFTLMKRPEFREKIGEDVDRSQEPLIPDEEAQQQFLDGN